MPQHVNVAAGLFCRETPAERLGRAQQSREEAVKWTVMGTWHTEAGTGSSIPSSAPLPPPRRGTWQVEGAEVMLSAQRRGSELLKKGTVCQLMHKNCAELVCVSVWVCTWGVVRMQVTVCSWKLVVYPSSLADAALFLLFVVFFQLVHMKHEFRRSSGI